MHVTDEFDFHRNIHNSHSHVYTGCRVSLGTMGFSSLIATYFELNKAQTEVARVVGREEIDLKAFSEGSRLVMLALAKSCQLVKKLPYLLQFTSKSQPGNN